MPFNAEKEHILFGGNRHLRFMPCQNCFLKDEEKKHQNKKFVYE